MKAELVLKSHLEQLQFLEPKEIDLILDQTVFRTGSKGEVILNEGQVQTQCYMVLQGCVREYILDDGVEKTTAFYCEGDKITSYNSGGQKAVSKHYLECAEDTIMTVSSQNFEDDLRKLIPRLDAIIQHVAKEELGKNKEAITNFISSSPEERYLNLLEHRPQLFNRVPQHQIASYLGIKPETLSRIRKRVNEKQRADS